MNVLRSSVVVHSTDREGAVHRYEKLLGAAAVAEFSIPRRELFVTVFPGLSVLSGSDEALAPVLGLRATLFVSSLREVDGWLRETGWTNEGALGSGASLLARDPDGNLLEFVEETAVRTESVRSLLAQPRQPPSG
jgi:hypothetical protein